MTKIFKWNSIGTQELPQSSGIYAWYYKPRLGIADINNLIEKLEGSICDIDKKKHISKFLDDRLFRFFSQPDYQVTASGPLMPKFSGSLNHVDNISSELIERILLDYNSISCIREILLELDVAFLSPIYVGMASNLSRRINTHKSLIEAIKTKSKLDTDIEEKDQCFAERVVQRKMIESYLEVVTYEIDSNNNEHNFAENLVNRISYPILGRN